MLTTPSESEQQKQTIEIARGQCKSTLGVGDSEVYSMLAGFGCTFYDFGVITKVTSKTVMLRRELHGVSTIRLHEFAENLIDSARRADNGVVQGSATDEGSCPGSRYKIQTTTLRQLSKEKFVIDRVGLDDERVRPRVPPRGCWGPRGDP